MQRVPSLLDALGENDVVTSFVVFGELANQHRDCIEEILKKRHEIVNHTLSHPHKFRETAPNQMRREVESFQELMVMQFGYRPQGFRAPHLMRRYDTHLFRVLGEQGLYDSSYIGQGTSIIDGVVEVPLTQCPDHSRLCLDLWHHFELPFLRSSLREFLRLWEQALRHGHFVNVYFDPHHVSDVFLEELIGRAPNGSSFCRLGDIAQVVLKQHNENRQEHS